jgi:hypothetical protein
MRKLKTLDLSTFAGTHIGTLDAPNLTKFQNTEYKKYLLNVFNHSIFVPNIVKLSA